MARVKFLEKIFEQRAIRANMGAIMRKTLILSALLTLLLAMGCSGESGSKESASQAPSSPVSQQSDDTMQQEMSQLCSYNGVHTHQGCKCNPGYTGFNCAGRACPGDCSGQGLCSEGTCICFQGFSGESCSERT